MKTPSKYEYQRRIQYPNVFLRLPKLVCIVAYKAVRYKRYYFWIHFSRRAYGVTVGRCYNCCLSSTVPRCLCTVTKLTKLQWINSIQTMATSTLDLKSEWRSSDDLGMPNSIGIEQATANTVCVIIKLDDAHGKLKRSYSVWHAVRLWRCLVKFLNNVNVWSTFTEYFILKWR